MRKQPGRISRTDYPQRNLHKATGRFLQLFGTKYVEVGRFSNSDAGGKRLKWVSEKDRLRIYPEVNLTVIDVILESKIDRITLRAEGKHVSVSLSSSLEAGSIRCLYEGP